MISDNICKLKNSSFSDARKCRAGSEVRSFEEGTNSCCFCLLLLEYFFTPKLVQNGLKTKIYKKLQVPEGQDITTESSDLNNHKGRSYD